MSDNVNTKVLDLKSAPAFPYQYTTRFHANGAPSDTEIFSGMTFRQFAAVKIMSGLASDSAWSDPQSMAAYAVQCVDALIGELEKCPTK